MLTIVVHEKGGDEPRRIRFTGQELSIGREEDNGLVLDRPNISKRHLVLRRVDGDLQVSDLESTNGTYVNGRRLIEPRLVVASDRIYIGDYVLSFEFDGETQHNHPTWPAGAPTWLGRRLQLDTVVMTSARRQAPAGSESAVVDAVASRTLQSVLTTLRGLDPLHGDVASERDREEAGMMIDALLADITDAGELDPMVDIAELRRRCLAEAVELGPLTELLDDPEVVEIHVVGSAPLRVIRRSASSPGTGTELTTMRFSCDRALQVAILRLARRAGQATDIQRPYLRGRIGDGFVLDGLISGPGAPFLAMRRAPSDAASLAGLVNEGALAFAMQEVLVAALQTHRRIVVIAPSHADAARFLSAAQAEIPQTARVVHLAQSAPHERDQGWVIFERGDLVGSDGEGSEALDVVARAGFDLLLVEDVSVHEASLVAEVLVRGHAGLLAAVRGVDALHGLERLAHLAWPETITRQRLLPQLAAGVDLWVRLGTWPGQRALVIEELGEYGDENGVLTARPLFRMARPAAGWIRCLPPGEAPRFVRELAAQGVSLPSNFLAAP